MASDQLQAGPNASTAAEDHLEDVVRYRAEADRCRQEARAAGDMVGHRLQWLSLAESYDKLADDAESAASLRATMPPRKITPR